VQNQAVQGLGQRLAHVPRELKLFVAASFTLGLAYSMIDATFNNFINERFTLTGWQRSFLELPRELPGLLVILVSALLWFLCSRRQAGVAMVLGVAGALLIGFVSSTYAIMVLCLFAYSLGQHLFMPLAASIGMELAEEGGAGRRLGQLNAIRNLATIAGSFLVYLGFKWLGFTFQHIFALAAVGLTVAAALLFTMQPQPAQKPAMYLKMHREYRLFYVLAVLFGSRKQLFITFAPWVLVTVFRQPTQTLATLLTVGGVIGILFQPLLGWAVDHWGERVVLAAEAVLLVFVCFGYGFSTFILPESVAFWVVCVCFLLDQMLMSVNMARSTYMKKIALRAADIQPALTLSVTLDHLFSIAIALLGGWIWSAFGFQYVFLLGVFIALANLLAAWQVRVPQAGRVPEAVLAAAVPEKTV
jgi:predicted MFS family arabinose efflux permease